MPQLIFQILKNNCTSQDIIFEIGITRATAYTGSFIVISFSSRFQTKQQLKTKVFLSLSLLEQSCITDSHYEQTMGCDVEQCSLLNMVLHCSDRCREVRAWAFRRVSSVLDPWASVMCHMLHPIQQGTINISQVVISDPIQLNSFATWGDHLGLNISIYPFRNNALEHHFGPFSCIDFHHAFRSYTSDQLYYTLLYNLRLNISIDPFLNNALELQCVAHSSCIDFLHVFHNSIYVLGAKYWSYQERFGQTW